MIKTSPHACSPFSGLLSLGYFAISAVASIYLYSSWSPSEPTSALQILGLAALGYGLLTVAVMPVALSRYGYTASGFKPSTQRVIRQTALCLPLPVLALAGLQFLSVTTFDGSAASWERLHITGDFVRALGGQESSNKWWTARTEEFLARKNWAHAFHSSAHIHVHDSGHCADLAGQEQKKVMESAFAAGDFVIAGMACTEMIDGSNKSGESQRSESEIHLDDIRQAAQKCCEADCK
ncbi:MAG: hypothetical protein K2W95_13105 [Candidatus Obscuribacterales bacterium]|nr:hypothetical protein [Candidatus Obscuribacterales bacterium]